MSGFTSTLTPAINEARAQAIALHTKRLHDIFALLADLTKDAKSYEEVALRFVDRGLICTHQPSDSVTCYQNVCEEFVSNVAPLLWIPERDALWINDAPDVPERSAPLQAYLAQQEGK
jgi:hypothetical protein